MSPLLFECSYLICYFKIVDSGSTHFTYHSFWLFSHSIWFLKIYFLCSAFLTPFLLNHSLNHNWSWYSCWSNLLIPPHPQTLLKFPALLDLFPGTQPLPHWPCYLSAPLQSEPSSYCPRIILPSHAVPQESPIQWNLKCLPCSSVCNPNYLAWHRRPITRGLWNFLLKLYFLPQSCFPPSLIL